MPGFRNINNSGLVFADNVDFTGDDTDPQPKVTLDGQLLIGSSVTPNIRVNRLTAGSGIEILNGNGTIRISAPGSTTDYHDAIYIVGTDASAQYPTIQSAITAASAVGGSQTIFIQPGTYDEDFSITTNLNFVSYSSLLRENTDNVIIQGKITISDSGINTSFYGINFVTDGDVSFSLTGTNSRVTCVSCYFTASNANSIYCTGDSSTNFYINTCSGSISNTFTLFTTTNAPVWIYNSLFRDISGTPAASTTSTGAVRLFDSTFHFPFATSSTGVIIANNSLFGTSQSPMVNTTYITTAGTGSTYITHCKLYSGTATNISVGAGTTVEVYDSVISSSNASAISGAGSIKYGAVNFIGTSSVNAVTTQTTTVESNDALNVVDPGAYPYTIKAQDAYISVNTSTAKTVNLPASPIKGQKHIISDITGSAFTNNVTVSGNGKNIDGSASYTMSSNYGCAKFIYNGTEWNVSALSNARDYHDSIYIVGSNASANYTTIASAYAAAVASGVPSTVFVQPGTYTENITASSQVNIAAHPCDSYSGNVIIQGKISCSYTGTMSISGIQLKTNGDYCVEQSGANTGTLKLVNCYIYAFNNTAMNLTSSSGSSTVELYNCKQESASNNIFFTKNGFSKLDIYGGSFNRDNSSTGVCTSAGTGSLQLFNVEYFRNSITTSNTSTLAISGCSILGTITSNSTTDAGINNCVLNSDTATAVSVGAGGSVTITNSTVSSSNANVFDGTGTIKFSNVTFSSTSSNINTTTQNPLVASNDAVKVTTPGAYPYTTVPQDELILVDSSSAANTITPLASPTTGQKHIIKDKSGNAATAGRNITITPSGKNIDGAASYVINTNYGSVTIIFGGTEWHVV